MQIIKLKNSIIGLILVLLLGIGVVSGPLGAEERNPNWAQAITLPHAENFFKVTPDLYRSAQPSKKAMESYEKFGIRTVINLRSLHDDRDEIKATSLNLIEIPINTWDIEDEDIRAALAAIKNAEKPVLVHCQHGSDRTGTVIAMHRLIFQNWSKAEALDELMNGGFGYHAIWVNIPRYINNVNLEETKNAVKLR